MDLSEDLAHAVRAARAQSRSLVITGSGSKRDWQTAGSGEVLAVTEHTGVIEYEPSELVVTVRGGTPLRELRQMLAREGQMLASDPPEFRGAGTVGGAVASGMSGPSRPWGGALRDAVLGVVLLNGQGEALRFGGQVVKNVAGYDVARLAAGSWGALGVVLEVSLRVTPIADGDLTLVYEYDAAQTLDQMRSIAKLPLPVSATFWQRDVLKVRFSGSEAALRNAQQRLGGYVDQRREMWTEVRDQAHAFYKPDDLSEERGGKHLVRAVLPPAAGLLSDYSDLAIEWGGGLRWFWVDDPAAITEAVSRLGGWVWIKGQSQSLDTGHAVLMQRIKDAFDPDGVFSSPLFEAE